VAPAGARPSSGRGSARCAARGIRSNSATRRARAPLRRRSPWAWGGTCAGCPALWRRPGGAGPGLGRGHRPGVG